MYATLPDLKTYLGIPAQETSDDELLDRLLDAAQAHIDTFCRCTFEVVAATTHTFTLDDCDLSRNMLFLDEQLAQINTVIVDGNAVTDYTTLPRVHTPYYALVRNGGWSDQVAVNGKWGYSTSAPADVTHAAIRMAAYLYRQRDNSADLDRTTVVGNATLLPVSLPSDLQTLLAPYRRVLI